MFFFFSRVKVTTTTTTQQRSVALQTIATVSSVVVPNITPIPVVPNTNFFGIKMVVRTPLATLSESAFEAAVLSRLQGGGVAASAVSVNYICPLAACPNIVGCPATVALRAAAGCREGGSATERDAQLLQASDNVVDFGFTTVNAAGSTAKYNELVAANTLFNQQLACTTCSLAPFSPQSSQLSQYNPTVSITQQPIVNNRLYGIRMLLRNLLAAFNRDNFAAAVLQALRNGGQTDVTGIVVNWACPASACGLNTNNCPTTTAARATAGCNNYVAGRGVEVLQAVATDVITDFNTLRTGVVPDLTSNTNSNTILQQQLSCVNTGVNCPLAPFNPQSTTTYQPVVNTNPPTVLFTPTPTPSPGGGGLEDWEIALIVIGSLLGLCCCLALAWYFCFRKKKNKRNNDKEMNYPPPQHMQSRGASTGSYDEYYTTDYPSYSYATEVFEPHDRVKALYIDGQWYDGEIAGQSPDGSYEIKWADGQHSEGIPGHQIQRI